MYSLYTYFFSQNMLKYTFSSSNMQIYATTIWVDLKNKIFSSIKSSIIIKKKILLTKLINIMTNN